MASFVFGGGNQGTIVAGPFNGVGANGIYPYLNQQAKLCQLSAAVRDPRKTFWITATNWGGATVSIETSANSVDWVAEQDPLLATTWTQNTKFNDWTSGNYYIRTTISGATATTSNLEVRITFGV